MNKLPDYLIKIVFVAVAIILWVFMALTAWDGITHSEPRVSPDRQFGLKEGKIIESSGVILYQNNTLIGNIPPATPKVQILGVMVDERNKEIIEKILFCESSNRHYLKDGSIIKGRAGERGVAQFKKQTFYWMAGLAKRNDLRWEDKEDQIWLLDWAISSGLARHWTCYRKVK